MEQITDDSIEDKYNRIITQRKISIEKYHKTISGKASLKRSGVKYYAKHKVKILAKKREKYRLDNPLVK